MKKILIVAPSWVGDAVMAQPLYQRLKQYHPQAQIDVLAPAWTLPLLRRMPEISDVIENPFAHGQLRLKDRWKLGRSLKARHYDQAILLPNSLKSALIPAFAGIPVRTGFVGEMRYGLLNDARVLKTDLLPRMVERFTILAEPANRSLTRPLPNPKLTVDLAVCKATAIQLDLALDQPIAALCPGAEYGPAKRWPVEHFASLAKRLKAQGYNVWLMGSAKDKVDGEAIASLSEGAAKNLCGHTSLEQAIDLIALSTVVICNDSGLMHVAAALERPLVALYGSSSPEFTPPLTDRCEILSLNLDCSPCFERECPLKHFRCLRELLPSHVEEAMGRLLQPAT